MKSTLEISGGGEPSRTFDLQDGTTTIGRADTNALVLNHVNISRSHVEIHVDAGGAQIVDLGSVNGTTVNDVKLAPQAWQPLNPGDRILVGPFQLSYDQEVASDATVVVDRAALAPPPPPPLPPMYPPPPVAPAPHPEPVTPPLAPAPSVRWAEPTPFPFVDAPRQDETPPVAAPLPPVAPIAPVPAPVAYVPVPPPMAPPERPSSFEALKSDATVGPVNIAPPPFETPPPYTPPPYVPPRPARRPSANVPMGREKVALILLAIAVALTLPASFAAWNERVLLNQSAFVSLGNKVLSEPAVQRELALQLSKEIDRTNSALLKDLGMPPELEQLTNDILNTIFGGSSSKTSTPGKATPDSFLDSIMLDTIQTLPNTPVADSALIATHDALKTAIRDSSVSTNNDVIALDIGEGMSELFGLAGIVGITNDELGSDFGRIEITKNADTVRALKFIRFFDGKAILFVLLVIVALGAGMYFADDRIRYTKHAGIAIIGSSVLWILAALVPMKSWSVGGGGDTGSAKAAVKATYDVIAGSYVQQELIVIGIGVVVLAIALFQSSKAAKAAAMMAPPAAGSTQG